jgi:NTP pyrophosphatase (non-canonical NTP hydrolase)
MGGDISQDNIKGVFGMENELSSIVEHFSPIFEVLKGKIEQWAEQKQLLPGNLDKQTMKLMEEAGELAGALLKNDRLGIIDSIGDCLVVLIILCKQLEITPENCLLHAWNEIKDRTGKNINGTFIKDLK